MSLYLLRNSIFQSLSQHESCVSVKSGESREKKRDNRQSKPLEVEEGDLPHSILFGSRGFDTPIYNKNDYKKDC